MIVTHTLVAINKNTDSIRKLTISKEIVEYFKIDYDVELDKFIVQSILIKLSTYMNVGQYYWILTKDE